MRRQLQDPREWHTVFAWLPVVTDDGQRIWLEHVERRYRFSSWWEDYFEYRPHPDRTKANGERNDDE